MQFALFALIVLVAHTAETVTGFGGTVIAVALAAQIFPLELILPVLVPVNLLLSLYIVVRHHRAIDRTTLFSRIIPFMGLGMAVGLAIFNYVPGRQLKTLFGVLVFTLAVFELFRLYRRAEEGELKPLSLGKSALWLLGGGIIHGIYASGGPLVVFYAGRQFPDKKVFRSTLSALWLILSSVLVASYLLSGALNTETLRLSAMLLPALAGGVLAGEWLHDRVGIGTFKVAVYVLLTLAGASLAVIG